MVILMIDKKDLELKLLLRESHIQQLNLKVERLNNIINKAIEYIEQHNDYFLLKREVKELLDILKGSDKEWD